MAVKGQGKSKPFPRDWGIWFLDMFHDSTRPRPGGLGDFRSDLYNWFSGLFLQLTSGLTSITDFRVDFRLQQLDT